MTDMPNDPYVPDPDDVTDDEAGDALGADDADDALGGQGADGLLDRLRGTGVGVEDPNIVGDAGPTDVAPGRDPGGGGLLVVEDEPTGDPPPTP